MHSITSALLAGGLLSAGIAAAQPCAKPADVTALDIASLKSKLMVTALTCNQQDRYNDFVQRFRSDLMTQERALHAYFVRTSGGRAQREHDDYITSLANTQSQSGIRQGTLFCQQNVGIFTEVLALAKGSELPGYAASKQLAQPIEVAACPCPDPYRAGQHQPPLANDTRVVAGSTLCQRRTSAACTSFCFCATPSRPGTTRNWPTATVR